MPNLIATATSMEDLYTRVIDFLTTDATLVSTNQNWQIMSNVRDNFQSITTNLTASLSQASNRTIEQTFRNDPRSIGINNPDSSEGCFVSTNFTPGTSQVTIRLRVATEITAIRITSNPASIPNIIQNFVLAHSNDGITFTNCLTVNSNPIYIGNDSKTFTIPTSTGARLFWRITITNNQSNTSSSVSWKGLHLLNESGVIANHFGSETILRGKGLSNTDNIFVGLRSEPNALNDWYNIFFNGYTGYSPSILSWFEQPGALDHFNVSSTLLSSPMIPLSNSSMPFWLTANGRRFILTVKVSTSFESAYVGFILPYATSNQYPYPLCIAGSMVPSNSSRGSQWRFSSNDAWHSGLPVPGSISQNINATPVSSTMYVRTPDGLWQSISQRNQALGVNAIQTMDQSTIPPYAITGARAALWPTSVREIGIGLRRDYRDCLGGGYLLQPLILHQSLPVPSVWGQLDGCFAISGFSNAAENTTIFDSKNHIIFNNVTRTSIFEYWAQVLD